MWAYRDGFFSDNQIEDIKKRMRTQIYYLLLYADENVNGKFEGVDVCTAFDGVLDQFSGLNTTLNYPPALIKVISLLEAAKAEYQKPNFDFTKYRRLVLDAGSEVLKIGEVK